MPDRQLHLLAVICPPGSVRPRNQGTVFESWQKRMVRYSGSVGGFKRRELDFQVRGSQDSPTEWPDAN